MCWSWPCPCLTPSKRAQNHPAEAVADASASRLPGHVSKAHAGTSEAVASLACSLNVMMLCSIVRSFLTRSCLSGYPGWQGSNVQSGLVLLTPIACPLPGYASDKDIYKLTAPMSVTCFLSIMSVQLKRPVHPPPPPLPHNQPEMAGAQIGWIGQGSTKLWPMCIPLCEALTSDILVISQPSSRGVRIREMHVSARSIEVQQLGSLERLLQASCKPARLIRLCQQWQHADISFFWCGGRQFWPAFSDLAEMHS